MATKWMQKCDNQKSLCFWHSEWISTLNLVSLLLLCLVSFLSFFLMTWLGVLNSLCNKINMKAEQLLNIKTSGAELRLVTFCPLLTGETKLWNIFGLSWLVLSILLMKVMFVSCLLKVLLNCFLWQAKSVTTVQLVLLSIQNKWWNGGY